MKRINVPTWFLFIAGTALRLFYIIITSVGERQHDVASFGSSDGHYGYIEYIMNHGVVPDFDPSTVFQFAHPPLHHMLCAGWLKLMTGVFGVDYSDAVESLQFLTLLYSVGLMYVCYRIFRYLKLEGVPLYVATAVVCFHPTFIFLSGSLNNDMLSVFLMALAILFALKWYRDDRWRDLIVSALACGLAVMTKLSAVFVAVPVGILLLVVLIRKIREHQVQRGITQMAVFAGISLPIGLWFPIYNAVRWDLPLFFVYKLSEGIPQFLGNESTWDRLFNFSPSKFSSVYEQWLSYTDAGPVSYNESNPLIVALKNSMFGEYIKDDTFEKIPAINGFCTVLFYVGATLALIAFVFMIRNLIRDRSERCFERLALGVFFLAMMIGYYVTAFRYPFVCTMDFRYIPLTVPVGAAFLGMGMNMCIKTENSGKNTKKIHPNNVFMYVICALVAVFCLCSTVMFIGLKFSV